MGFANPQPILPRAGYQKTLLRIRPKGATPEHFYRGSTVLTTTLSHVEWVGGPVPISSGFPIEAFGNDRLEVLEYLLLSTLQGIKPAEIEKSSIESCRSSAGSFAICFTVRSAFLEIPFKKKGEARRATLPKNRARSKIVPPQ
jgi:hypothetical protein